MQGRALPGGAGPARLGQPPRRPGRRRTPDTFYSQQSRSRIRASGVAGPDRGASPAGRGAPGAGGLAGPTGLPAAGTGFPAKCGAPRAWAAGRGAELPHAPVERPVGRSRAADIAAAAARAQRKQPAGVETLV